MNKLDARIINSKKFLKIALLALLSEKRLSEIKVVTLCTHAEINRATFYSHYNNVYQLFDEILEEFMDVICGLINKINDSEQKDEKQKCFIKLIKYIDDNSDLFVMIFENSNNFELTSNQYRELQNKIHHKLKDNYDTISVYITNYYIYSGGSVLYTWIKNGKKESHIEIGKLLYTLVNKGTSMFKTN